MGSPLTGHLAIALIFCCAALGFLPIGHAFNCTLAVTGGCTTNSSLVNVTSTQVHTSLDSAFTSDSTLTPSTLSWDHLYTFQKPTNFMLNISFVAIDTGYDPTQTASQLRRGALLQDTTTVLNTYCKIGGDVSADVGVDITCPSPSPSPSSSSSPSPTRTPSPSNSPSNTPTRSPSPTTSPTGSPSNSPTPSISVTPSNSPPNSPTNSPTRSPTPSISTSPTNSPTNSPTRSPTPSISISPTNSPSNSPSRSATPSISHSPSVTPSISISPSATPSISISPSATPSISISPSGSPSISRTPSATPSGTQSPSRSPTPSITASPSPTPSVTPSPSISPIVKNMCLQSFGAVYSSGVAFEVLGNQTVFTEALTSNFASLLGTAWFSIFVRQYETTNTSVTFSYVIYYWSASSTLVSDNLISYSLLSVSQVTNSGSSTQIKFSLKGGGTQCSTTDSGLSPGATAGIAIGAVAGGVAGAGALAGVAAAGYAVYRHMNRAPPPEQLASGDTAFVDNTSNDNKLFTSNQAEYQNELYSL